MKHVHMLLVPLAVSGCVQTTPLDDSPTGIEADGSLSGSAAQTSCGSVTGIGAHTGASGGSPVAASGGAVSGGVGGVGAGDGGAGEGGGAAGGDSGSAAGGEAASGSGVAPEGGIGGAAGAGAGTGGADTGGGGGAVSSGPWRPFSGDSPWNTPIADNPTLDPESAAMVADFETSSPYGEHLDVNITGYSVPLFYADASTPTTAVTCDIGGEGFASADGFNATAYVPIPAGAAPDPQTDHHLLIVDRERNLEWGMWNTSNSAGVWHCGLGATADLTGTGVRPYKPTNPTWYTSHGARACGFPLIAGLIRPEEIEAGYIDHALVVAYPHIRSGFYTSPASTAQATVGSDAITTRGIPCGGRIQLDPSIDLGSLNLSRAGMIIAEALQRYGAYVGDYSGAISLYADGSPDGRAYWAAGVLDTYELSGVIDLAWFRVIQLGPLTNDGNG